MLDISGVINPKAGSGHEETINQQGFFKLIGQEFIVAKRVGEHYDDNGIESYFGVVAYVLLH